MKLYLCSRCSALKPAEAFPRNVSKQNGLDSWCLDCRRDYGRNYMPKRPHATSPHVGRAVTALEQGDPLKYSRAVCEHVAWYVQRKITEFETLNQIEVPPHLTAILGIAKSISAQHPKPSRKGAEPLELKCLRCDETFTARTPTTMYCAGCRAIIDKNRRKSWKKSAAGRVSRAAWNRKLRAKSCEDCGTAMLATRHRRYCDACVDQRQRQRGYQLAVKAAKLLEPREISCRTCGASIIAKSSAQKYCANCRVKRDRESNVAARLRYKQRQREAS